MKTQLILASYETLSFFVFPVRAAATRQQGDVLPDILDWEPCSTPGDKGQLHAHILVQHDVPLFKTKTNERK
jgi:hypothetical protein